jgi:hypothetical protein
MFCIILNSKSSIDRVLFLVSSFAPSAASTCLYASEKIPAGGFFFKFESRNFFFSSPRFTTTQHLRKPTRLAFVFVLVLSTRLFPTSNWFTPIVFNLVSMLEKLRNLLEQWMQHSLVVADSGEAQSWPPHSWMVQLIFPPCVKCRVRRMPSEKENKINGWSLQQLSNEPFWIVFTSWQMQATQ